MKVERYDVIVVGLGPAGATAARLLQRGGLRVIAFDRERFPRYKPCGGCLSKKIDTLIDFDISGVVEHTISGAVFTSRFERELTILSERPIGYMVQRERFDTLLVEMAKAEGVEVRDGEGVVEVVEGDGHVRAVTEKGTYEGRYLIGADGPFSIVARTFFPDLKGLTGVAMEGEAKVSGEILGKLEGVAWIDFGYVPYGYGWVFPKDGAISVGVAGLKQEVEDIKECFKGFLRGKGLESLTFSRLRGWVIPAFNDTSSRLARGRVALVGDAGNLVDPFLGEGIYYAMKSATIVANEVLHGWDSIDPGRVEGALRSELFSEFEAASKVADLVYNYPDLWYSVLEQNTSLMEDYYRVLRGEKDYHFFLEDIRRRIKGSFILWLKVASSILIKKVKRFLRAGTRGPSRR